MKIYCVTQGPLGESSSVYEGQDKATIEMLLTERGLTVDFVDEATYVAFEQSHKPPEKPDLSNEKAVLKDKNAATQDRLDALVKILGL